MIYYNIIVYLLLYLCLASIYIYFPLLINDPANKRWNIDPQLLISFDNESLWAVIGVSVH